MPEINILLTAKNQASPSIKQVDSDIGNLDKRANDTSKGGVGMLAGALGTGLKVAAGVGAAALVGLGAAVGVTGTNFNNMKEQATIAFSTMLGSGQQAKVFLDDLQQFAAKTPFEFPELLQASQRLLAMGFAAKDVKPTLTAVGDAVAALGGSSEMVGRVTTALGQMQAKGKASGEEMMQLTEAGIPAWQMLADAIGTNVADAMDQVSKGTVSADVAIGALVNGMNTQFGGLMEKQSQTFGGLFSTIKDTFAQVSGTVMQPLFELMTEGLKMIVDWTSSPQFTGGIAQLTNWLEMAADAARAFFGDLTTGKSVVDAVDHALRILLPPEMFTAWEKFRGVLDSVFAAARLLVTGDFTGGIFGFEEDHPAINALFIMRQAFTGLMDVIQGRVTFLEHIGSLWGNIWELGKEAFSRLLGFIQTNLPVWQANLTEWANAAWRWIVDAAPLVLKKLGDWSKAIFTWLGNKLPDFLATVLKWGTALYKWIGDTIPKAVDALSSFVRGLRDTGEGEGSNQLSSMAKGWAGILWSWIKNDLIPKVGPAFSDFIRSMLTYGQKLLTSLGTLAKELGQTLWAWIVAITPTALKKLGEWGSALWNWIKEKAPAWRDKLAEWAAIAWQWIRDTAIPEATKKLGEWGTALWDWVTDNAPKWREKLGEWAVAAWEWIRDDAIPNALTQLAAWGTELIDWLKENWPIWRDNMIEAGKEMITGLRDGIEIAWIRLTDWFFSDTAFGGFVGDILGLLNVQLGPAYGTIYENGKKITYSLNEGSRYGLPALRETGADMGKAISSGLQTNLDMHSPSRVMWGFGSDIIAGLQGSIHAGVAGLRSEMQYVADQIKETMARANREMLAEIDYFTQQALVKTQAAHYQIANATKDAAGILKQLGIDTSKVTGLGPNGELILQGKGNPLMPGAPGYKAPPAVGAPVIAEKDITTLGEAIGPGLKKVIVSSLDLLGGINVKTFDPASDEAHAVKNSVSNLSAALTETLTKAATLIPESTSEIQLVINDMLASLGQAVGQAAKGFTASKDSQEFKDSLFGLVKFINEQVTESKGMLTTLGASTEVKSQVDSLFQQLITNINGQVTSVKDAVLTKNGPSTVEGFIAGLGDFLKSTLEGAGSVFNNFKSQEEKAYREGNLSEFINSETNETKNRLKGLYQSIQNSIADVLGISSSELDVTGTGSLSLVERLKQIISGTSIDSNADFIGELLQDLVNFRTLANSATTKSIYDNPLPNDPRLTGQPVGSNTTNTFNITVQGGNSATSDIMGLIPLLNSLYGTAPP